MLRRAEPRRPMCGKGLLSRWEPSPARGGEAELSEQEAFQQQQRLPAPLKGRPPSRRGFFGRGGGGGRLACPPRRRGRYPSSSCARPSARQHYLQQQQQARARRPPCYRPAARRPRVLLSLRPLNLMGKRAPGMRAPRNTNQFLMGEKYQLMHLRSDSVGTESGGSDCEMDPLDMDSYLGVLENARGALLDGPDCAPPLPGLLPLSPPTSAAAAQSPSPRRRFLDGCLAGEGALQEESLQYFPSEDDVIESEIFMERDFHEFYSRVA